MKESPEAFVFKAAGTYTMPEGKPWELPWVPALPRFASPPIATKRGTRLISAANLHGDRYLALVSGRKPGGRG